MNIPASIKRIETISVDFGLSALDTRMNIPASIKRIETSGGASNVPARFDV